MTSAVPIIGARPSVNKEIAQFLCAIARPKPQDENAARAYSWALRLDPKCAPAFNGLGRVEAGRGNFDAALDSYTKAVWLQPDYAEALVHRGVAYDRLGYSELALRDFRSAVAIDPSMLVAELQQFGILENLDRSDEALEVLEQALAKRPGDADLLFCRATLKLAAGDFATGWRDYESRPTKLQLNALLDEYQEWDGSPLEGKRILICREQGLGDEIMFARLIPEVAKRGGHVILYCYPPLARLFAQIPGVQEVVTTDQAVPDFDCWVAMGSLPLVLDMRLDPAPYIKTVIPEPKTDGFRVGICWKGNPQHARDAYRSIAFSELRPLLEVPGVEWVSLQKDDPGNGQMEVITGDYVEGMANRCHDFLDLARAISGLDLVISVDTSVAHLAGALGIPCWVLLGKPVDWRWNTPLYESVKLFYNEAPKQWGSVIRELAVTLQGQSEVKRHEHTWTNDGEHLNDTFCSICFEDIDATKHQPAPVATAETRYGRMQYFANDIWLGRSLKLYGEWSEGECDLYRKVIGPKDWVIEVGANIGAHTVVLAGLAGEVFAFEPSKDAFDLLEQNVSGRDVICQQLALGSEQAKARLHRPANNPGGTEIKTGMDRMNYMVPCIGNVDVDTIDRQFLRFDFLKLDCEGSELAVLQGAEQTIARCRPLLYVENDRQDKSDALIAWLDAHDYRIYQHHTPLFNPDNFRGYKVNVFGNLVSAMLFCVPNERKDMRPGEWGMGMDRVRVSRR